MSGARSVSDAHRERVEGSWAAPFRDKVLPVLLRLEAHYQDLYADGKGRPNWSVARMLALFLLQEMFDLPDQQALDALAFDTRWWEALGISARDATLSRRSYVDFRARLYREDPEGLLQKRMFTELGKAQVLDLKVGTCSVRIDSTQVRSNIRTRGRADLFGQTLARFWLELGHCAPALADELPRAFRDWAEAERRGDFAWFDKGVAATRLAQLAGWAVDVHDTFAGHPVVAGLEAYALVGRLIDEHLTVTRVDPAAATVIVRPDAAGTEAGDGPGASPVQQDAGASGGPGPTAGHEGGGASAGASGSADAGGGPEDPHTQEDLPDAGESTPESPAADAAPVRAEAAGETPGVSPGAAGGRRVDVHRLQSASTALQSPHDPDAGYGHKGQGYSAQVTETYGNESCEVILDFDVHAAGISDQGKASEAVARLTANGQRPEVANVDAGYVSPSELAAFEEARVELRGPMALGSLRKDAHGRDHWRIDHDTGRLLACSEGNPVVKWAERRNSEGVKSLHAYVSAGKCKGCPLAAQCLVRGRGQEGARLYYIEDRPELILRDRRLTEQRTPAWRAGYRPRAGIEATMSELKRGHGLGQLRVRRLVRVRVAIANKLAACNVKRWCRAVAG